MIASAQTLRRLRPVSPLVERQRFNGLTYGLGPAGIDLRIGQLVSLDVGEFRLASCVEHFTMPPQLLGVVHDKSTWARMGLAVQNTVIEPGWRGHLTIELSNHGPERITILAGTPICQVIFHLLDEPTDRPYEGKYQDQPSGPQQAIFEKAP